MMKGRKARHEKRFCNTECIVSILVRFIAEFNAQGIPKAKHLSFSVIAIALDERVQQPTSFAVAATDNAPAWLSSWRCFLDDTIT